MTEYLSDVDPILVAFNTLDLLGERHSVGSPCSAARKAYREMCAAKERAEAEVVVLRGANARLKEAQKNIAANLQSAREGLDEFVDECDALVDERESLREQVNKLLVDLGKLQKMVTEMWGLICESRGVDGLHLNGDTAPWETLMAGGEFEEWLPSWERSEEP